MEENMKIGLVVVISVLILFGGVYFLGGNEIKKANINGYAFLEKISGCNIVYNIDITTRKVVPEFNKECLEDATKNLRDITFRPGEKGDKFILESEEYLGCAEINKLKGAEAYKNCIKKILPKLNEKYFGFVGD